MKLIPSSYGAGSLCAGLVFLAGAAMAQDFQVIHSFNQAKGPTHPYAGLTLAADGNLYGTTRFGGSNDLGTIFRITTAGGLTTLVNFGDSPAIGARPWADLILGDDGCLYGTTESGGSSGAGTVFKMTTNGILTTLVSLSGNEMGGRPIGNLAKSSAGDFYGTTRDGGPYGGVAFKLATNGAFAVIVRFNDTYTNGAFPEAGLTFGPDGNLYGTASSGGDFWGNGTVFRMTTNGELTALVVFAAPSGSNPRAGLALGPDGSFYGTTHFGGIGGGTVFKVTTNSSLTYLVSFGGTNGANPTAGLLLGPDGDFYGTTCYGGSGGKGTVFKITTNGLLTTLVNFDGTNGDYPLAKLTLGADGSLYGTACNGGSGGRGVIYRLGLPPTIIGQPYIRSISQNPDRTITLSLVGTPGSTNRLWATTNCSLPIFQWELRATLVASNGVFQFRDEITNPSAKFYRLSMPVEEF